MILATPKFGGHYTVDALTGALTVAVSIALWRKLTFAYAGNLPYTSKSRTRAL
jgi:16S rRNA C1402 (ribose-2'-O) methylase RsmI